MKCEHCKRKFKDGAIVYELMSGNIITGVYGDMCSDPTDSLFMWCEKCENKRQPLEFKSGRQKKNRKSKQS